MGREGTVCKKRYRATVASELQLVVLSGKDPMQLMDERHLRSARGLIMYSGIACATHANSLPALVHTTIG